MKIKFSLTLPSKNYFKYIRILLSLLLFWDWTLIQMFGGWHDLEDSFKQARGRRVLNLNVSDLYLSSIVILASI